jgi:hypothetical protein
MSDAASAECRFPRFVKHLSKLPVTSGAKDRALMTSRGGLGCYHRSPTVDILRFLQLLGRQGRCEAYF